MMSGKDEKKSGFTLIEVLVTMAITIVVVYGAFTFFNEQRKTFRQQSEQANKQANLRLGLYYLAQDIALAGYTGTPFGLEAAIHRANVEKVIDTFPVRLINPINYVWADPELSELYDDSIPENSNGDPLDAIEIWANFDPNGSFADLALDASQGVATIFVNRVDIFVRTIQKPDGSTDTVHPVGVIISTLRSDVEAEYHQIVSVDTSANSITLDSALHYDYYAYKDWVAPVYRRKYFVQELREGNRLVRWLTRRDYFAGNNHYDYLIAQGVDDLQIFLDIKDSNNKIEMEVEPSTAVDCCQIIGVTVQVSGLVQNLEMKRPVLHTMRRKVKIVNADVFEFLDSCGACLYQL